MWVTSSFRTPGTQFGRALLGLLTALMVVVAGLTVAAPARAADTDVVAIPDANLKAAANASIAQISGTTRTPTQDITEAEARLATGIANTQFPGPVADLTGLQAFTNLTQLLVNQPGSTFSDLSPIASLTAIKTLQLSQARVVNIAPLAGLVNLTSLTLASNQIVDLAPIAGLTKLTTLQASLNAIRDVSTFPSMPGLVTLNLNGNKISNPSPLVDKFAPATLTTLNLGANRITDAAALDALGPDGSKLRTATSTTTGLILTGNRIRDLSPFADWQASQPNRVGGQSIYLGPYQSGGVTVVLKSSNATAPAVTPATAGTYDPATGHLEVATRPPRASASP